LPAVFFFQAEDGIRDFHVTGVQTCALPISLLKLSRSVTVVPPHTRTSLSALADQSGPVAAPVRVAVPVGVPSGTVTWNSTACSAPGRTGRSATFAGSTDQPSGTSSDTDARTTGRSTARRDRKSTRLNSSHVNISYAVFCLK